MSVLVLGETGQTSLVSKEVVEALARKHGFTIPQSELQGWSTLLTGLNHCAKEVLDMPNYYPHVDTTLYPRIKIHHPLGEEEIDYGGWATEAIIKCT